MALKRAAAVCALIVRLFDQEQVIGESRNQIVKIFMRLLKETDQSTRKFTVFYACEIGKEGLFVTDDDFLVYFNNVFPSMFHLAQTDIQAPYSDLLWVARLVNAQLRFHEPDNSKNPPSALRVFLSGNKRMQTVVHEMIDIFFLHKTSYQELRYEAV